MFDTQSPQREILANMSKALRKLIQLIKDDRRYKIEAYIFLQGALNYAQEELGMGGGPVSGERARRDAGSSKPERHVTGQELCEAIRLYALDQFGLMAKLVLNSWGVHATSDFGEIVYNLIRIEHLRKSESDRREDFDNVYDFDEAFQRQFQITLTS